MYAYINDWVHGILINARCNNDGRLLMNGDDTKNATSYSTVYIAKKQGKNYNMSAVMAKGYGYHLNHLQDSAYIDNLQDVQRLLLFWLVQAINHEQELARPIVVSYLMGWGDTYHSHHYSPIYWSTFVCYLFKEAPDL